MVAASTLHLDDETTRMLDEYRRASGLSREQAIRELLRLRALSLSVQRHAPEFERAARSAGYQSEDDLLNSKL